MGFFRKLKVITRRREEIHISQIDGEGIHQGNTQNTQNLEAPFTEHSQAKLNGLVRQKEKYQNQYSVLYFFWTAAFSCYFCGTK